MGESVKATIIGTIILGIFLLISVKMTLSTAWEMARKTKAYVEIQKEEFKQMAADKNKTAEIILKAKETGNGLKK